MSYSDRVKKVFCTPLESGNMGFTWARGVSVSKEDLLLPEELLKKIINRRLQMLHLSMLRKTYMTIHELDTGHEPFSCGCDPEDYIPDVVLRKKEKL
jgi:hypothetical protein